MNIIIRPLVEDDAYTSVKWRNDPEVFKYTGSVYKNEITIKNELEWIRKVTANRNEYRCAIEVDGIYVGNIYLTNINSDNAHYHIFIGNKRFWGKGVAKAASLLILDYAFNNLKLKSVYLRVNSANNSAIHLYNKLGFNKYQEKDGWIYMIKKSPLF